MHRRRAVDLFVRFSQANWLVAGKARAGESFLHLERGSCRWLQVYVASIHGRVVEVHVRLAAWLLLWHILKFIQMTACFHRLEPARCRFGHLNNIGQVHAGCSVLNALKTANFFLDRTFRRPDTVQFLLYEYLILQRHEIIPSRGHLVVNRIVLPWVSHLTQFVELFIQWLASDLRVVRIAAHKVLFLRSRMLTCIRVALPNRTVDVEFVRNTLVGRKLLFQPLETVPILSVLL